MAAQQPSARSLIWRNGLIFGAVIIAITIVNALVSWKLGAFDISAQLNPSTAPRDPLVTLFRPSALIGYVAGLVNWVLFFLAGMLTARKTGTVGSASLTGLVAGALGALVGGIASLILVIAVIAPQIHVPASSLLTESQLQAIVIGGAIFGFIIGLVVDAGIGAGLGALGGLAGRGSYQQINPPQAYQESFYGAPAGGYAPPPPPYVSPSAPEAPPSAPPQN